MRLLFWVATALEWRAACPWHTGPLPEQELLEFTDGHGQRHYLCITGVGPVNAGMAAGLCMAELRHKAPVDAAVNLGVAGSFDLTRAPLGSAWRVQHEIFPEYGLACDTTVDARALGFAQWQPASPEADADNAAASAVWNSIDLPSPTRGTWASGLAEKIRTLPTAASLTVAGVTADAARAARLHAKYGQRSHADGGPLLENMEGFALALACARHGLPLLELRTVSNAVGPRTPETRDFPKALAALQPLLRNLLNMVENG